MKRKITVILRVLISVGLIAFLLWCMRGNFPEIKRTLVKTNPVLFLMAAGFLIANVAILLSLRLRLLLAGEGIHILLGKVSQLNFIGYFFNNFMPTAVGGDIVKGYYVYRQTKEAARSFISVFMDRFIGLFSFVCIAIVAVLISWGSVQASLRNIVLIFALSGSVIFIVILNNAMAKTILNILSKLKLWNAGERISRVYRAVHEYKDKKSIIFKAMAISIASQTVYFIVVYMLIKSLGINLSIATVFLVMPIVSVISMLPSLGGLGLREGAMVALFGPFIASDNAFSVSILLLTTLLILSLIGAIIYLFASQFKIKEKDISELETYRV